jgi:hypothetical protein
MLIVRDAEYAHSAEAEAVSTLLLSSSERQSTPPALNSSVRQ